MSTPGEGQREAAISDALAKRYWNDARFNALVHQVAAEISARVAPDAGHALVRETSARIVDHVERALHNAGASVTEPASEETMRHGAPLEPAFCSCDQPDTESCRFATESGGCPCACHPGRLPGALKDWLARRPQAVVLPDPIKPKARSAEDLLPGETEKDRAARMGWAPAFADAERWHVTDHGDEQWIHNERRDNAPALVTISAEEIFHSDPDMEEGEASNEAWRIAHVIADALNRADAGADVEGPSEHHKWCFTRRGGRTCDCAALYAETGSASPSAPAEPPEAAIGGVVCKTHGKAVLVTHIDDGEACTDYLRAHRAALSVSTSAPKETSEPPTELFFCDRWGEVTWWTRNEKGVSFSGAEDAPESISEDAPPGWSVWGGTRGPLTKEDFADPGHPVNAEWNAEFNLQPGDEFWRGRLREATPAEVAAFFDLEPLATPEPAEPREERRFPVLGSRPPATISWADAEVAYAEYARRFPSSARGQSIEVIAKRGGFSADEIREFMPPAEPREETSK